MIYEKKDLDNKKNDLQNDLETDYRILKGEVNVERLYLKDIIEIVKYGWDKNDLQRMMDEQNYHEIGHLAAWIRECGEVDHGFMVEDDPYLYPLDEDGNYTEQGLAGCY